MDSLILIELGVQTTAGPFVGVNGMIDTGSQITTISEEVVKKLGVKLSPRKKSHILHNDTGDMGEFPVHEANLMIKTRDAGMAILDGFEVVVLPEGNGMVVGLDCLSRFSYKISDGKAYLLSQIAS